MKLLILPLLSVLTSVMLLGCRTEAEEPMSQAEQTSGMTVVMGKEGNAEPPQHITSPFIPASLHFAGEAVPLHRADVREALENELTVNMYRHSRTMSTLKNFERWRPLIENTLEADGVPKDFIYLAVAESELDNTAESYVGAMGMWQFMEATAKDFDLHIDKDVDMRRDPKLATAAAARYLNWAYETFSNWTLVAASYNRGVSGIKNNLNDQQATSFYDLHLNPETARYIYRILAFKLILENPEAYGYFLGPEDRYSPYQFKTEKVADDVNLVEYAKQHNITYKELRLLNPWFNNTNDYKLNVPANRTYELRVPATR